MSRTKISHLPPEILEKIFIHLTSDLETCRSVSLVCTAFHSVMVQVPVLVTIPIKDPDLRWIRRNKVPVRYLYNCEISAYVSDQIFSLNISQLKVFTLYIFVNRHRRLVYI